MNTDGNTVNVIICVAAVISAGAAFISAIMAYCTWKFSTKLSTRDKMNRLKLAILILTASMQGREA